MNKKFLSAILFGALVVSAGSFVSCADNDDDIKQLQDQNSELKAQLAALKTDLQAELKNAASAAQVAAVEAKLSAIESATAENMKATVDALNGKFDTYEAKMVAVNTQLKALEGLQGVDASELIAALEKAKENGSADMNTLSAMVDALDADVNVLLSELRSLVFQPEFYLDGIEAAEYTYLQYAKLANNVDQFVGDKKDNLGNAIALDEKFVWGYYHQGDIDGSDIAGPYTTEGSKNVNNDYSSLLDKDKKSTGIQTVLPSNILKFAMNPSNAKLDTTAMNIVTKTICALTRGAESEIKIDGYKKDGKYLAVKYHFTDLKQLITPANKEQKIDVTNQSVLDQKDNTTIVKLSVGLDEDRTIESDWAAIYETSIQPVAFGLTKKAWDAKVGKDNYLTCGGPLQPKTHEYLKNPYEALKQAPIFELGWDDANGIDLKEMINVHLVKRDLRNYQGTEEDTIHYEMTLAEVEEAFNMKASFVPVKYTTEAAGNKTNPTAYVDNKKIEESGVVKAGHVNADASFNAEPGESSIGKQPLVQVLLKDAAGDIVLDCYIHIKITRTVANVMIAAIDLKDKAYACDSIKYDITWSEYSKLILQDEKVKMSKAELDSNYVIVEDPTGEVAQFTKDFKALAAKDRFSKIIVKKDSLANTNHVFEVAVWKYAQQWVYEQENHSATVYVQFKAKNQDGVTNSKYDNIFVPMQFAIKDYAGVTLGTKIPEYWYAADGTPTVTPDDAIRFNVDYPANNGTTKNFVSQINEAWKGNLAQFFKDGKTDGIDQNHKYYFHPVTNNIVVVNEYTKDSISLWVANEDPFKGAVVKYADEKAKIEAAIAAGNFVSYKKWAAGEAWKGAKATKFDSIYQKGIEAGIKFTQDAELNYKLNSDEGMYKNTVIMATVTAGPNKGKTALVATLDQTVTPKTGEIIYANNEVSKLVLNAITHATASQEAYVGVAKMPCDVEFVENDVFPIYFIRPIDIIGNSEETVTDAVANGEYVSVFDKFSFVDFRDVPFGAGQDVKNIWLAAYYNINSVKVDLANATTTLGTKEGEEPKWSKLAEISTKVKLTYVQENKTTEAADNTITLNTSAYDKESMGVQSTLDTFVKHFGYIKYENNGTNVADFQVKIPVIVGYEWGEVQTYITVTFKGTLANS